MGVGRRARALVAERLGENEKAGDVAITGLLIFGRGERIRTSDPSVPNRVLYQAEPRPD